MTLLDSISYSLLSPYVSLESKLEKHPISTALTADHLETRANYVGPRT